MVCVAVVNSGASDTLCCFPLQVSPRDVNRFQLVSVCVQVHVSDLWVVITTRAEQCSSSS